MTGPTKSFLAAVKITRIDHIGIAVRDLSDSISLYRDIFNLPFEGIEEVKDAGVRTAFFRAGGTLIELLEPLNDESPIAGFLKKKGAGIHHICYAVENIEDALDALRERGIALINDKPVAGAHGNRIAFLHPKSTGGVLIELAQLPEN